MVFPKNISSDAKFLLSDAIFLGSSQNRRDQIPVKSLSQDPAYVALWFDNIFSVPMQVLGSLIF